jgi:hypothetical protein
LVCLPSGQRILSLCKASRLAVVPIQLPVRRLPVSVVNRPGREAEKLRYLLPSLRMSRAVPQLPYMPFWYAPVQMYGSIALRTAVFSKRVSAVEFMTVRKFCVVSQTNGSCIFSCDLKMAIYIYIVGYYSQFH